LGEERIPPEWLTPSVAESLDARGRFILASPTLHASEHQIAALRAIADSLVMWLRTAQAPFAEKLQLERGDYSSLVPIDFPSLRLCGREYGMLSPYPTVDTMLPNFFRNMVSSQVRFVACDGRGEAVAIVVAGRTDVTFPGGIPTTPLKGSGNSFLVLGLGKLVNSFLSPEAAVHVVRRRTGDLIVSVPDGRGPLYYVQEGLCPTWRVTTAATHTVIARGVPQPLERSVFYVSALGCIVYPPGTLLVAADSQPDVNVVPTIFIDTTTSVPRDTSIVLEALPFTRFQVVEPQASRLSAR
jgi:hypothetical protein